MTLYFLHGLNGNPQAWNVFLPYFQNRGYSCEAVDLQKGFVLRKIHFQDYVEKLVGMVNADDIVIGHSMGGLLMQKVAEQTTIRAGIGICSAPPKGISFHPTPFYKSLKYLPYILFGIPFKPSPAYARKFFLQDLTEHEAAKVIDSLKKQSAHVTYEVMRNKIAVDASKIHAPLFFIATDKDKLISPSIAQAIADRYNAPLKITPGTHHIYSRWKPIAEAINDYLLSL